MTTLTETIDLSALIRYIDPEILTYLNHQQQLFDRGWQGLQWGSLED